MMIPAFAGECRADGWVSVPLCVRAGGLHRLRDHRPRAGQPAYAADFGLQFRARHRAGRCHGRARPRRRHGREGDRLRCGAARRGQCRRRLRGDRTHAGNVQAQREERRSRVIAWLPLLVKASYFAAALLFILGIKRMASPLTARSGIQWAGAGMVLATVATFFYQDENGIGMHNIGLILLALAISVSAAWISGKKVAMTDMPQMVALYNGMGGGSAAAIGAVELLRFSARGQAPSQTALVLGVVGALIGSISLTGSIIAWAKLDGRMDKRFTFPGQQLFNGLVFLAAIAFGIAAIVTLDQVWIIAFFAAALAVGIL